MADKDNKDDRELSEDEKLAAEWEAAMGESGDSDESSGEDRADEWAAAMEEAEDTGGKQSSAKKESGGKQVKAAPLEDFGDLEAPRVPGTEPDLDVQRWRPWALACWWWWG